MRAVLRPHIFKIPPLPLKAAAARAREAARSPANGHTVLTADAAPTKRSAARLCRDRVSHSRAKSPKKRRSTVASGDERFATSAELASPGAGEADSQADCLAIVHSPAVAASDDVHGSTAATIAVRGSRDRAIARHAKNANPSSKCMKGKRAKTAPIPTGPTIYWMTWYSHFTSSRWSL